ncbi:O-antigen ligase family protein [Winogradskyella bathintestinalis]|uniref:O-antigen ligase family protein n=1 Tax=Winogradskyella bathintestinalis TaxID=3035208 RepID=A0ABT7ZSR9_9FLAO|nr:O-antigen ligase family protein [Winogradskyella bathintestinalis]MDN3492048.1 O-antigen ligase family protein [Winogradskyella bathintestinalis]
MLKKYLYFNYFYIFIVLIWPPFQKFVIRVDGAANSIVILTVILLAFQLKKKRFFKTVFKKPLLIYAIWVAYAILNALLIGYYLNVPILTLFITIFVPLVLMIIISIEFLKNEKKLLNVLIVGLYIAVVLILLFIGETDKGRTGGELNSNTIGTMATILVMLLYLKFYKQWLTLLHFSLLLIIPVFMIISAGSRTAFGGLVFLLLVHFIVNRSKNIFVLFSKISLGIIIFAIPFHFVLENTILGDRVLNTTEQSEGMEFQTGNPILDQFGDRGIFYYQGWYVFKEHPITGVGLGNFVNYNEFGLAQHSEYMIQLSELGIIGFILFAFFYFNVFKSLKNIKKTTRNKNKKREVELYIFYVLIILLMITATRMYRVWFLFVITGIVIGYINKHKLMYFNKFKEFSNIK